MEYIDIKKLIDVIRRETKKHANTKERVSKVLDELLDFTKNNYQLAGNYVLQEDLNNYLNSKLNVDGSNIEDLEEWKVILNYYDKTETYSKEEIHGFLSGKQDTIGYTPENSANKSDSYTNSSSVTYSSTKALVDGLDTKLDKGTYTGTAQDLKNDINNLEGENVAQYDLINDLNSELDSERARNDAQDSRLENLEGINYTWSPTNRTLTLYDNNGTQLSQVSLVSLDNEGTDIRYNSTTLSLELYNADNELLDSIPVSSFIGSVGTQLQLNSNQLQLRDSQGNILSTVSFSIVNIPGLQTALNSKLEKGNFPGNAGDLKTEIDGKLNKPTTTSNTTSYPYVVGEDGNGNSARLPAGDLGKNFFNSDLSNTTARNHTMNAGVTVKTLGNPHTLSGLPNKNADITNFRKVRVQNASGLDSVVDSKNLLTDGVTSMTDAEKDAWRLAQRKTNETYSTASPQVDGILPPVINGNETFNQFVTLVGLNLFVNNSSPSIAILEIRRVKDINGIILSTPDIFTGLNIEVSQNNPTILSTSINFSAMPKGYYKAFVTHNGLTNLTSPEIFVGDVISTVALPSPFWIEQTNGSPTISNTQISSTSASPTTYRSAVLTNASLLQNGFIAEYVCEFSGSGAGLGSTGVGTFGIIGDDNTIYGIAIYSRYDGKRTSVFLPDGSAMNATGTIGLTNKMYIIYKNDIVTVINQSTGKVKSFVDPSFKNTNKKAYYDMTGISGSYSNSGSMTFNNIKSF